MEAQTQFVLDYFGQQNRGKTFVEVGASDGITISTTYPLEKDYGWSGICVEPHPVAFAKLKQNRANCICYGCGIAVVQEHHRSYSNVYNLSNSREIYEGSLRRSFGEDFARTLGVVPMINAGVFAMPAACTLWQRWGELLGYALQSECFNLTEQTALNMACYEREPFPFPYFLPATHNWICVQSLPAFDPQSQMYVEPLLPWSQIGIIHQTNWRINRPKDAIVKDVYGNPTVMDLTFSQWKKLHQG